MTRQFEGAPSAGRTAVIQIAAAVAIALVVLSAVALNLAVLDSGSDAPAGSSVATGATV